jgi:hypothetical protein
VIERRSDIALLRAVRYANDGASGISHAHDYEPRNMKEGIALARMEREGLVTRFRQSEYCDLIRRRRSYWLYRITESGRKSLIPVLPATVTI